MEKTIALIPGDGIGPDVVAEAVNVLDVVAKKFGHKFNYKTVLAGGCATPEMQRKTLGKNEDVEKLINAIVDDEK